MVVVPNSQKISSSTHRRDMVDSGIQCEIGIDTLRNAETNTIGMEIPPEEFDGLDIIVLNRLADRLNVDHRTMMATSRQVLSEMKQSNIYYSNSEEEEGPQDTTWEGPSIFDDAIDVDEGEECFNAYLDVGLLGSGSAMSTTGESFISGSTPRSEIYWDY